MEKRVRKTVIAPEVVNLGNRIREIIKEKGLKTREVAHDNITCTQHHTVTCRMGKTTSPDDYLGSLPRPLVFS